MKATLTPQEKTNLPNNTSILNPREQIIVLKEKKTTHYVEINQITHLTCDCYITTIFTDNGEKVVVSKLLKDFEAELEQYGFIRTNRNAIINHRYIKRYERGGNRTVYLRNNITLKASRRGLMKLKLILEQS